MKRQYQEITVMNKSTRCLYNNDFATFLYEDNDKILGCLQGNYHGVILPEASEAWGAEISIMKET